jgi:hypothetical protein
MPVILTTRMAIGTAYLDLIWLRDSAHRALVTGYSSRRAAGYGTRWPFDHHHRSGAEMIERPPPGGGAIIAMLKLAGASEQTQIRHRNFDTVE